MDGNEIILAESCGASNELNMAMTIRDKFAALAMQGQIAFEGMEGCNVDDVAAMAYELADAMIIRKNINKHL